MSWLFNPVDSLVRAMTTKTYAENPFGTVTAMMKLQPKNVVEACIRATTGLEVSRPLGSPNVQSPWEKLFLNPRQLFQLPPKDVDAIKTHTVIGRHAQQPLDLEMPIIVTGMSYGGSLSLPIKRAVARGAALAGTATNTGESAVSDEERNEAKLLIGQYHRGGWLNRPEHLKRVDAIEIQLGQGAWGGAAPSTIKADTMDEHLRTVWGLKEGEDGVIESRLPDVQGEGDLAKLVDKLKNEYPVPVGVKIAGTHFIERELAVVAATDADYVAIDGSEGGTANSMATLQDDIGLPTLYCAARAGRWLAEHDPDHRLDLIIAGGLRSPGEFLKALALGADAVYIGSIALTAALADQIAKALPGQMIPQLELYTGKLTDAIDIQTSAENLFRFLKSCAHEMQHAALVVGRESVHELTRADLCCADHHLAEALGVDWAGLPGQSDA